MKLKKLIVLPLALFLLLGLLSVCFWWRWANQPLVQNKEIEPIIFVIHPGESVVSITRRLDEEQIVRSGLAFRILLQNKGFTQKIQAGDFRLFPNSTPDQIASSLTHGTLDVWLTFPEGWRREQYALRLASALDNFDFEKFLELSVGKEGYLFPDTYLIPKDAGALEVLEILEANFQNRVTVELQEKAAQKGLDLARVIILASILEREENTEKDLPLVAGILIKRLRHDWPLQADATVQYALAEQYFQSVDEANLFTAMSDYDWWPNNLTGEDLKIDSPYNTYQFKGLPPAPICNPGLAVIQAVINYRESDYWFYLSGTTGETHYARTNDEHNENVRLYLR